MQQVGVEFIVKGLSNFTRSMDTANRSLQDLRPPQTALQKGFGFLTDALGSFGDSIIRIAENALGFLFRDAVLGAINLVKELAQSIFDAGNEFQTLELRLERLNFNDLRESGMDFVDAQRESIEMTQEQILWIQRLAASSPFDAADVTQLYTLARSYGFSADEAQRLTTTVTDFSAGMGLGSEALERIIVNLGQLKAQGKLNGQELRDLARGAFVPVNDVMEIFAEKASESGLITQDFTEKIKEEEEKLNKLEDQLAVAIQKQAEFTDTTKESTRMANQMKIDSLRSEIADTVKSLEELKETSGSAVEITMDNIDELKRKGLLKGDNVIDLFIESFEELVDTRFVGAAEKMSRTWQAAIGNIKDIAVGSFGLNTMGPILDVLGEKAANFADSFTKNPATWDALVASTTRLGEAIGSVVDGILDLIPGTDDLATTVIGLIDQAAQWVEENRENIIGFFKNMGETIATDVIPWIKETLIPAIQEFIKWIIDNKDVIIGFFKELGATIWEDLVPFVREHLIPLFKEFGQWFVDNKDQILLLFDQLGDAIIQLAEVYLPKILDAMQWITDNPDKVEKVINIWAKWQVVGTILNQVGGILLSILGVVLSVIAIGPNLLGFLSGVGGLLGNIWGLLTGLLAPLAELAGAFVTQFGSFIIPIMLGLITLLATWKFLWNDVKIFIKNFGPFLEEQFTKWKEGIQGVIDSFKEAFASGEWTDIGKAIIEGIAEGFMLSTGTLLDTILWIGDMMKEAFVTNFGIQSPSKVFAKYGQNIMQGLAVGINESAGLAAGSMAAAMTQVASAAAPSVTNSTTVNYNNNLTVNSSAGIEPILQDFEMLTSLAGA